ncbi:photosynthetic reaction center subunit H [Pseudahrensia aquimaris]|uniref:Photosynthetic reaction center subunit H n=1 Tax=Pseudahrensia aquimaris TaxID=744461 RepID=A0ABW3FH43_9HYPH
MVEITGYIDVAQMVLYAFWVFFAGLIWYLQAESRREGYPLEDDVTGAYNPDPWLQLPSPKTFKLPHGMGERTYPNMENRDTRPIKARRASATSGSPLIPTGNAMKDGVGPAAWAERPDHPDMTPHGTAKIQPLAVATDFHISENDVDPRGLNVVGPDGEIAGQIVDVWVDQTESYIRYLEMKFGRNNRLIPLHFAVQRSARGGGREYYVHNLTKDHWSDVPRTKSKTEITMLEEEKIMGYFGGGGLYAMPGRAEPLL